MRRNRLFALSCLLALAASYPSEEAAADIPGVVYNPTNRHYYKLYTSGTNWNTAKSNAEALGGYLACIADGAENTFIVNNLGVSASPYIGGSDSASEGTWTWVSGETWNYSNWGPGEPNNLGNEDALQFRTDGMWNDINENNSNQYIVEWDTDPNGPPEDPTNLAAPTVLDNRVDLTWSDNSGRETGYEVERQLGTGPWSRIASLAANAVAYADAAVYGSTTYSYRVRATGTAGNSNWTNTVTVTTQPAPVTDLAANVLTNTRVELTWALGGTARSAIEVERGAGYPGQNFARIATLAQDATYYLDAAAQPETTYAYRLRAIKAAGGTSTTPEVAVTMPPATPTGLVLTAPTDRRVTLTWGDTSLAETGFEVMRADGCSGTNFGLLATLPPDATGYADTTAQPETTYAYRVRAVNQNGTSDWTSYVCVTTPPFAPTNVVAQALSTYRVRVTWTDNTAIETRYELERALVTQGLFAPIASLGPNVTEYEDAAATQEATYVYRVAAVGANGRSGWGLTEETRTPAILAIRTVVLTQPRGAGKAPAVASLAVTGEFDVGGRQVDLSRAAAIGVGADTVAIPGFEPKGKGFRYQAEGLSVQLAGGQASSRVLFKLLVAGDVAAGLDPGGDLTLTYTNGAFQALGTVRLEGGRFLNAKQGAFVDPLFAPLSIGASLRQGAKDSLVIKAQFHAPNGVPDAASDVTIEFGYFQFKARKQDFTRKDDVWTFAQTLGGSRKVVLDYAKGLVSIALKSVELGGYTKGPVPVHVAVDFGDVHFDDTPTMVSTGGSVRY